jgi:hypothetical protein
MRGTAILLEPDFLIFFSTCNGQFFLSKSSHIDEPTTPWPTSISMSSFSVPSGKFISDANHITISFALSKELLFEIPCLLNVRSRKLAIAKM